MQRARSAREYSYSPYSRFAVGAALLGTDGSVFTACNVENASYGLSMCAERAAVFAALGSGVREFAALAIAGPGGVATLPCGACRQVLAEFNPALRVTYTEGGGVVETTLGALLPSPFLPDNLQAPS